MATHFTDHQQQAIDDGHQNILVSASAGSGKTSVLVERVIQKLLHQENIDELLVVTFTDAAAKGMRDRIAKALRKAIDSTDDEQLKAHLKIQINRLAVADISTLHSFCLHLIKQYYYVIDLDPQFRLMTDDTEKQLLREGVWDDVREEFYAQNNDVFERLTQNFSNDRSDDGLTEVVQKVDEFANSTPDPEKWLNGLVKSYQLDAAMLAETSLYQQQLLPIFLETLNQAQTDLEAAIATTAGDEAFDKVELILTTELDHVKAVIDAVQTKSWDTTFKLLHEFEYVTFRGPSKTKYPEASEEFLAIKKARNDAKDAVVKLTETYFLQLEADAKNVTRETEILIAKLVEVVKAYRVAFAAEKRLKHTLDFNDLEHFAYQILTDPSPEGQAVVEQLKAHYTEVMVDEYQDTNQLQESILQQIVSDNPGNMFMVGDVKQSIYQFRQADPSLFMGKYNQYRQAENPDGEAIVLAENFRSVGNVINFTNLIFEQLMDSQVGEMEYDDDAHLKFGAKADYDTNKDASTEILFYESDAIKVDAEHQGDESEPADLTEENLDKSIGEAVMVGQRIQQMVQQHETVIDRASGEDRQIQYGDIAILVSSRTNNPIIEEQFALLGIPVTLSGSENYFQATEVRIMMSLMRIIDNPYQDIPLVAVLRSPIVGLDENELAYLRIQNKTDQYYQAIQEFAQRTDVTDDFGQQLHEKITKFLEQLAKFKQIAKQNRLVDLIWTIFEDTGFLDYVGGMPGGRQRQANLHALYNRAHDYEKSSFKGIFQFVRFINQMQKNDQDLAEAQTQVDTNTVNVMTIHGSKGLEFPVVIMMNATGQFNKSDFQKSPFILDLYNGIGVTYLNPQRIKVDTIQKQLLKDDKNRKNQSEEMRLLYVAMTRAEQRLIITGKGRSGAKKIESWEKAFQATNLPLPPTLRLQANNFMQWIGMALVRHPKFDQSLLSGLPALPELKNDPAKFTFRIVTEADLGINESPVTAEIKPEPVAKVPVNLTAEQQTMIKQLLNYQYPYQAATKTTAYQSVSEIKRLFDDPDNHELIQLDLGDADKQQGRYTQIELGKPQFLRGDKAPSAAEIGTATHLIFQLLDLNHSPSIEDVERLIQQLTIAKTIPEVIANKINREAVVEFYQSDFGQQVIANQQQLQRETPFSLLLPASQLFEDLKDSDEEILIHGIIDGYFKTDDGLTIFDYKTDDVHDNIDEIIEKYRGQVNLYSEALSRIEQSPVVHKYLYLLSINQLVEL
ncbi:ATP-dependent nuclease subunit A [Paucilactobacillus oligofermentans DSM 15707 = LMG 22743]|uniref:ATP-dependent helicase/nuclease subunit A n=1 Tax=Paucilactobacillus oligofermentans DSM 15707 = LMG 22743 TaxID=1423778 RepID=A0A0R1RNW9_9LACO|nr:helicase-exonuclease AddAB subunit AddA [Paucilactobacillus oligofermentans]KRL55733.1 ATP-dependent nuclease subunit A [Paucilactobacillus oligofermentans DSM 15707 = LMG 22743]CUS27046.1 ATP-dependent helicase/nuclease subunit A AddA [Paucilactobacillus oligofermentans DSM 15707 = LMG 22743]